VRSSAVTALAMVVSACGEAYVDDSDQPPGNGWSLDADLRIAPEFRDSEPWDDGPFQLWALISVDLDPIESIACGEKLTSGQDYRANSARSSWTGASDVGRVSGGSATGLVNASTIRIYGAVVPREDEITPAGRRIVAGFVDLEVTSDACRFTGDDDQDRSPPMCIVSRFECAVGSCLSLLIWDLEILLDREFECE